MATIRLGDLAPNFQANTTEGVIDFYQWMEDSWCVFFSHPADYTPVCTTELGTAAKYKDRFARRNVKIIALSVDGIDSHHAWIKDINETQRTEINYPIISDADKSISTLYDMIHTNASDSQTVRSVFIIDPSKKIRLIISYPASTGRNFFELLRVIDSLQLTDEYQVATPANWNNGDQCVILPSISTDQAKELFPQGVDEVKPYLRMTPQPNLG